MTINKLGQEKSLYLQQHADNPIHWQPYSAQALKMAKELNKLIFLSIGYSSCHWCHVMAHESFEDAEIASFLNEHFISIKVDKEEYPDLDNYFQTASSIISGATGWPLNVFLTPEGHPFFGGTYFPKEAKNGQTTFLELLMQIQSNWIKNSQQILENGKKTAEEMKKPIKIEKKIEFQGHFPAPSAILNALKNFADTKNGGYGKAPKFPHFPFYEWACEQILEGMIPQEQGQHIVETLERMMMGGVYDHAKGGIHRYSTDDKYLVPHFEKMLYDQAGLLKVLSKLSQFYPAPIIFDGLLQTIDYIRTEMTSDDHYFFSSQDADSEGVEGLYFTFSKEEFEASFEEAPPEQKIKIDQYSKWFNISEKGNFDHGLNVLSLNPQMKSEYYTQDGWQEVRDIRRRLLEQRKLRIPPSTDRKGLSTYNYMLISALADVVHYCPIDIIRNEAFKLIQESIEGCIKQFIKTDESGRHVLKHSNTLEAQSLYLEDYVQFSEAQLRLYEITGNQVFKNNCLESIDFILNHFVHDQKIFITNVHSPTPGLDNLPAPFYDQSYRSSSMTLVHLLSRVSVFKPEWSPEKIFNDQYKEFSQFVLTNPLGHGEGLRALTYPQNIFRKVEVPIEWIENPDFLNLRSHFYSRFVMDYHNRKDDSYQICTLSSCEVSGKGIQQFQEIFKGKEDQNA